MYKIIDEYEFSKAFVDMDRENQFSKRALEALFDYMERLEDDTGEPYELDVIEICCDFVEYESLEELQEDYPDIESQEDAEYYTSVVLWDDDCIVIQRY